MAGVLTIAVGVWMLFVTAQLWGAIRAGQVEQHPMFSHAAHAAAVGGGGGDGGGAPPAYPAYPPQAASGMQQQLPAVGQGGGYQRYNGEQPVV